METLALAKEQDRFSEGSPKIKTFHCYGIFAKYFIKNDDDA